MTLRTRGEWTEGGRRKPVSLSMTEARRNLSDIVTRAGYCGQEFVITRQGRRVAGIVSMRRLLDLWTTDRKEVDRYVAESTKGLTVGEAMARRTQIELDMLERHTESGEVRGNTRADRTMEPDEGGVL